MNTALNVLTSINGRKFIGSLRRFSGRTVPSGEGKVVPVLD
jgi:hypothetical protein